MGSQLTDAAKMLDQLDKSAGKDPSAAKRSATRRTWRKPLKVTITHPGGNQRNVAVVTRNLSSGGLSFLHDGFLNPGTRCHTRLVIEDGAAVDVQGTVLRCRYVSGHVHEVSLRFDKPMDELKLSSQKLSARILLVDDAEDVLRLTGHFLSEAGAEVVTANCGDQALKLVAEHEFDLVLLDVEMPDISGPDVGKTLRERGITIPIIAFTANDDDATREVCLAAGCSDVLIKPMGTADLIDAVTRYLALDEPIVSKHAGNPEFAEFIRDFINDLPVRIKEMHGCVQSQSVKDLGALTRRLKVAASDDGGCGFGELSAAADALAKTLTETVDWAVVEKAMFALGNLSHRVRETGE